MAACWSVAQTVGRCPSLSRNGRDGLIPERRVPRLPSENSNIEAAVPAPEFVAQRR